MPTIAEQISKNSTTPSSNIAEALEGYNGGGGSGSGGGILLLTEEYDEATDTTYLNKTAKEIVEAGKDQRLLPILQIQQVDGSYNVSVYSYQLVRIVAAAGGRGTYTFTFINVLSDGNGGVTRTEATYIADSYNDKPRAPQSTT